VSADDTASGDAAADAERVIDRFIWQDGDREDVPEIIAAAPVHDTSAVTDELDIVARLAPRRLDGPDWLPRIVTSSLPSRPPALPGDDRWHLELAATLPDTVDGATAAPAGPPPLALHVPPSRSRPVPPEAGPKYHQPRVVDEASLFAAEWHKAPRVLAAAAIITCVFSTGVLWAMHRSEMVADAGVQPIDVAAMAPEPIADGDAAGSRPIRNTPVLVREGETRVILSELAAAPMVPASAAAPELPLIFNGGESAQPVPVAQVVPIAPVVRTVAIVPIVLSGPAAVAVPSPLSSPPLDRDRLADLAARPPPADVSAHVPASNAAAEKPRFHAKTDARPKQREPAKHSVHAKRKSHSPAQSRSAAPKVARGYVPPAAWEMRRQGLRTDPQPEPSTLKKLIGYVWPFNKSSTAAAPAEPAKPAAPAVTAHPFSWTDDARARP
jgi:hypothetical protein